MLEPLRLTMLKFGSDDRCDEITHDGPGVHRKRHDTLMTVIDVGKLGEPQEGKLRGLIGAHPRSREVGPDGGSVDDGFVASFEKQGEEGARHEVRAFEILPNQ